MTLVLVFWYAVEIINILDICIHYRCEIPLWMYELTMTTRYNVFSVKSTLTQWFFTTYKVVFLYRKPHSMVQ